MNYAETHDLQLDDSESGEMTILNSQKINNDPIPHKDNHGNRHPAPFRGGWCGDCVTRLEQRPRFDNNPNRILVAFRDYCIDATPAELQRAAVLWLDALNDPRIESEAAKTLDEIYATPVRRSYYESTEAHARKVMERLAACHDGKGIS